MDFKKLEEEVVRSITNTVKHIKKQHYWYDVNAFCLYTDESLMSLSLLFNTHTHLGSVTKKPYPLTYKYSPAEWFSETLSNIDDEYLYNNTAFSSVSLQMMNFSMSDEFEENENRENVIQACLRAIKQCLDITKFQTSKPSLFLFMISDNYDKNEILNWNISLNNVAIQKELIEWMTDER